VDIKWQKQDASFLIVGEIIPSEVTSEDISNEIIGEIAASFGVIEWFEEEEENQ